MTIVPKTLDRYTTERLRRVLEIGRALKVGNSCAALARELNCVAATVREARDIFNAFGEEVIKGRLDEEEAKRGGRHRDARAGAQEGCQYHVVRDGKAVRCGGAGWPYCKAHKEMTAPLGSGVSLKGADRVVTGGRRRKR